MKEYQSTQRRQLIAQVVTLLNEADSPFTDQGLAQLVKRHRDFATLAQSLVGWPIAVNAAFNLKHVFLEGHVSDQELRQYTSSQRKSMTTEAQREVTKHVTLCTICSARLQRLTLKHDQIGDLVVPAGPSQPRRIVDDLRGVGNAPVSISHMKGLRKKK